MCHFNSYNNCQDSSEMKQSISLLTLKLLELFNSYFLFLLKIKILKSNVTQEKFTKVNIFPNNFNI